MANLPVRRELLRSLTSNPELLRRLEDLFSTVATNATVSSQDALNAALLAQASAATAQASAATAQASAATAQAGAATAQASAATAQEADALGVWRHAPAGITLYAGDGVIIRRVAGGFSAEVDPGHVAQIARQAIHARP